MKTPISYLLTAIAIFLPIGLVYLAVQDDNAPPGSRAASENRGSPHTRRPIRVADQPASRDLTHERQHEPLPGDETDETSAAGERRGAELLTAASVQTRVGPSQPDASDSTEDHATEVSRSKGRDGGAPDQRKTARPDAAPGKVQTGLGSRGAVPEGVVLKRAPDEVNQRAFEKLSQAFAQGEGFLQAGMVQKGVVCGPLLWAELSDQVSLEGIDSIPMPVTLPSEKGESLELEGRVFRGTGVTPLLEALGDRYVGVPPPKISYPTELDYFIFWQLIPFDIEEPLLAVEIEGSRILVLMDEALHVTWIESMSDLFPR